MPVTLNVARLSDDQLLASAIDLARRERSLNLKIIEHLREIGRRGLHLQHGYGSLFDYAVKELEFSEGSAYQRLQALKLSDEFPEVKQDLAEGDLSLTSVGYLQSAFDRHQRRSRQRARPQRRGGTDGTLAGGDEPRDGEAGAAAGALPADGTPGAAPLSAAAKRELITRARGKSTRQVRELIAEFDPELVRPRDRLRTLGRDRWEIKAVIDSECRRGLEQLLHWLSHLNPAMDYGELLQRVVADAVAKYDPARGPARAARKTRAAPGVAAGKGLPVVEHQTRDAAVGAVEVRSGTAQADSAAVAGPPRSWREQRDGASPRQTSRRRSQRQKDTVVAESVCTDSRIPAGNTVSIAASRPNDPPSMSRPDRAVRATVAASGAPENFAVSGNTRGGRRRGVDGGAVATFAQKEPDLSESAARGAGGRRRRATVTRTIPAAVRRHIWLRDGGRCTYRDPATGRCCGARHLLQIDHIQPFAIGGANSEDNLRLLCSAHNRDRGSRRAGRHRSAADEQTSALGGRP